MDMGGLAVLQPSRTAWPVNGTAPPNDIGGCQAIRSSLRNLGGRVFTRAVISFNPVLQASRHLGEASYRSLSQETPASSET